MKCHAYGCTRCTGYAERKGEFYDECVSCGHTKQNHQSPDESGKDHKR